MSLRRLLREKCTGMEKGQAHDQQVEWNFLINLELQGILLEG